MSDIKTLTRSRSNRMVAGVCAGLGDYLKIDPTIIRQGRGVAKPAKKEKDPSGKN